MAPEKTLPDDPETRAGESSGEGSREPPENQGPPEGRTLAPEATRAEGPKRDRRPPDAPTELGEDAGAAEPAGAVREDRDQTTDFDASGDSDAQSTLSYEATRKDRAFVLPRDPVGDALSGKRRYRFLRPHARGGLGEVSVALDEELGREVALKELADFHAKNPQLRARFLLEAKVTGGLEHPGIVPIYGLGTYPDGRPYYAMRFIRGDSLQEAIDDLHDPETTRSFDERMLLRRRLVRRFIGVCEAIAYAHSRGVLHRDIKPANIMLGPYGETLVVDWGLAKIADEPDDTSPGSPDDSPDPMTLHDEAHPTDTLQGATLGTPAFMSPEQALGLHDELGPASDVFGLGATLYTLLTGELPYSESEDEGNAAPKGVNPDDLSLDTEAGALARAKRAVFPRPRILDRSISAPLESICLKAMAEKSLDRYESARSMADDLERWLAGEPVEAHREGFLERTRRALRRRRTLGMVSLATFVASMGVALAAQQRIQTITHPPLEVQLVDAGLLLLEREQPASAAPLFREALKVSTVRVEPDPTDPLGATVGLALALHRLDRDGEAIALLRDLVAIRNERLGSGAFLTASAESALGEILLEQGALAEARKLLERSHLVISREAEDAPYVQHWSLERMARLREVLAEPGNAGTMAPAPED